MKDLSTLHYYDDNAESYINDTLYADMHCLQDKFISFLPEKAHILDAGCGSGRDTCYFLNRGFSVTAIDASEKMCELASRVINQSVLHMSFEEIPFVNEFDGIWACASILHVERSNQNKVIKKISDALKPNGIFYISWKYGKKEYYVEDRLYCDMTEELILDLIKNDDNLSILNMWQTYDVRGKNGSQKWLNVILRRR